MAGYAQHSTLGLNQIVAWKNMGKTAISYLMPSHTISCRLMPSQHLPSTGFSYMHDRQAIRLRNPPPAFMQDVTRQHTLHANKLDQNHQKRYHLSLRAQSRNDTRIKKAPHSQRSPSNGCADLFRFGPMMTRRRHSLQLKQVLRCGTVR